MREPEARKGSEFETRLGYMVRSYFKRIKTQGVKVRT